MRRLAPLLAVLAAAAGAAPLPPLTRGDRLSPALLATVAALQRFNEIVSAEDRSRIGPLLQEVGFELQALAEGAPATRGLVATRGTELVLAFRGTVSEGDVRGTVRNAATDLRAVLPERPDFVELAPGARIHRGFHQAWKDLRGPLVETVRRFPRHRVWVTGFSLGAALATLASLDLAVNQGREVFGLYLGSPRVGERDFVRAFGDRVPLALRVALDPDVIPRVPFDRRFGHVGKLLQLDERGRRVPVEQIDGRLLGNLGWGHDRRQYTRVLDGLAGACGGEPGRCRDPDGRDVLAEAARAEEASRDRR